MATGARPWLGEAERSGVAPRAHRGMATEARPWLGEAERSGAAWRAHRRLNDRGVEGSSSTRRSIMIGSTIDRFDRDRHSKEKLTKSDELAS
jgi:hypothetical protein